MIYVWARRVWAAATGGLRAAVLLQGADPQVRGQPEARGLHARGRLYSSLGEAGGRAVLGSGRWRSVRPLLECWCRRPRHHLVTFYIPASYFVRPGALAALVGRSVLCKRSLRLAVRLRPAVRLSARTCHSGYCNELLQQLHEDRRRRQPLQSCGYSAANACHPLSSPLAEASTPPQPTTPLTTSLPCKSAAELQPYANDLATAECPICFEPVMQKQERGQDVAVFPVPQI